MKTFGIDISIWQGEFNLTAAKKEGAEFAIIKGGGGDDGLYVDKKFGINYLEAKRLSLPVGAYWYSKATTVSQAEKEAEYFYEKVVRGRKFELPLFVDVEDKAMLSLTTDTLTDIVDKWCAVLENKGCFVGVYASLNTFKNHLDDTRLARYIHWVAQWTKRCTYGNKDILGFWQFGGETNLIRSNKVAGVVCDQNYMYKDFPALIKEKGFNGFEKAENATPPTVIKTVNDIATEVIAGLWGNGSERKERLTKSGYSYAAVQAEVDRRMKPKPTAAPTEKIKVGDLATLLPSAVIYGTEKKFASFVYTTLLYVREISGSRAVVSVLPEGPVTGAVDIKHLKKYTP